MRFDGKLDQWNDDRGFGFILPLHGGEPVFVQISAFPGDSRRPKIGEPLTFELEPARDGKKQAVNVKRPGYRLPAPATTQPHSTGERRHDRGLAFRSIAIALALLAVGGYAYTRFVGSGPRASVAAPDSTSGAPSTSTSAAATARFRCDGRTRCSQMSSCEEATFFLRNCPGTQMDGDGDGIPCEQQWCTSALRR
jgi:cold shock CspA family protein